MLWIVYIVIILAMTTVRLLSVCVSMSQYTYREGGGARGTMIVRKHHQGVGVFHPTLAVTGTRKHLIWNYCLYTMDNHVKKVPDLVMRDSIFYECCTPIK